MVRAGLERLEYRGYDSAGIAWAAESGVDVQKGVGPVALLPVTPDGPERLAIGHTRWATHGIVTAANAHPHTDATGRFAVVHNGTLEHARELRVELERQGHSFRSDTDSEILVHRYEQARRVSAPVEALRQTLSNLEGSWAVLLLDSEAGGIAFAANRAPLLVGLADDALFLASDPTAVLEHTRRIVFLDEGDHGFAGPNGLAIFDRDGRPKPATVTVLDWNLQQAERAGYPHFMLKEIMEAPTAVNQCLAGRLRLNPLAVDTGGGRLLAAARRLVFVGCGTSYHAAQLGARLFERWAGIPAQAVLASHFASRLAEPGTLLVAVSQSGETYDTLEAVRHARHNMIPVLAITNVQGSNIQRLADATIQLRVGPELGVAATKTYFGQTALLALLAIEAGLARGRQGLASAASQIERLPRLLEQVLSNASKIDAVGRRLAEAQSLFFLGRDTGVSAALESALKFKEVTYRHAEAHEASELKHGPFALLDAATPCVFFVPAGESARKMMATALEVASRGAPCVAFHQGPLDDLEGIVDAAVAMPPCDEEISPILFTLAGQLLAYSAGVALVRPVDRPRNLAKSVTVP